MSRIASLYTDEIKRQFKVLYANWEPGGHINLGDYGIMAGNCFYPKGNLKKDFEEFDGDLIKIQEDPFKDHKEFVSGSGVEVNLAAKGSINVEGVSAKASLEIKFSHKDSIFFNAADCTTTRIENKVKIGEILKELMKKKNGPKWLKEYCVVTDLVKAGRTIIAISAGANAGISLSADSPVIENINLADASVKLNVGTEKSIGYKCVAEEGTILLLGLCKMKNPFIWSGGGFNPRVLNMTESMISKIEDAEGIETEKSPDELIFAQLGKE